MWLLSPLYWLLIALAVMALGALWRPVRRGVVMLGALLAVVSVVAMTPLVGNALTGVLESPGPRDAVCDADGGPRVAAVLAGGVDAPVRHAEDFSGLGLSSRRRMEHAVAWWRQAPGRSLVVSGGPSSTRPASTAHLMAAYARQLGVPAEAIRVEGESLTTWQNAHFLAKLEPRLPGRVVLVTSAMHMPRARYAMNHAGFDVCEEPADSRVLPFGLPGFVIPGTSALVKTEAALHEGVGALYYRYAALRRSGRLPGEVPQD